MANLLGIDIGSDSIRVALLRTSYRRFAIDSLHECALADFPSTAEAVRSAVAAVHARGESISVNLPGDRVFVRRIELPATATRQLGEVLPFELEAQLPFDLEDAVFDNRLLPRSGAQGPIEVLAAVARIDHISERIELVKSATNQEPERIEPASFALANLAIAIEELDREGPFVVVHLDATATDVAVMRSGQIEMARTITGGTEGLPAAAKPLARDLRQTLVAWRKAGGQPPAAAYVAGPGATLSGAEAYLAAELGMPVTPLPAMRLEGATPERAQELTRFARAVGLALGLTPRPRSMNMRQGPLAYERGYGFLREKIPLLAGIGALIVTSFAFSAWMEMRAIDRQTEVLEEALAAVSQDVIGETIRDPKMAEDAVSVTPSKMDDPMPQIDGFDLMVEISKAVPTDITHDIEEFDFQKGKATIHGIVTTIPEAQQIATALQTVSCLQNVKIVRTTKVVNEDRQKYVLELDIKCPLPGEESASKDQSKGGSDPSEAAAEEGSPPADDSEDEE